MKTILPLLALVLVVSTKTYGQITSPVTRANFGVDADLRSNYFNGSVSTGNDDWFVHPSSSGYGEFVIDTTGAAKIVAGYNANVANRRLPFYRNMRFPGYTVINNRLVLDAVFIRDYHGDDSTVFASGANKNGDNPANWQCPVSQGVPDKNDILDMMVHVRRAGPNRTDSLWMFGGLSLDNTTGNRDFDFEMYQTDIYYDRPSRQFYGYGPDAGHTSWQFDGAGNVTVPGDIIFSAEYQSSSLSNIEARIWVNRAALSITPTSFDWTGQFDGASTSATYGYASIKPKASGAYYTGLQCGNNTWGGPFGVVLQNDALATDYDAKQFVEFSVNLTKLGLDPVTLLGSNSCGMPFRRILVKTRASASFTSELKDFVGPFDFFLSPRVQALTQTPYICDGSSIAKVDVVNPVSTSVYQWRTTDGNIITSTSDPTIYVNKPGTYIVTQYLQAGCSAYASDTVTVYPMPSCTVLGANRIFDFKGVQSASGLRLSWRVEDNAQAQTFEVQQSADGIHFNSIATVNTQPSATQSAAYSFRVPFALGGVYYYRIKLVNVEAATTYSNALRFTAGGTVEGNRLMIYPNPVTDVAQLQITAQKAGEMSIEIYTASGYKIYAAISYAQAGLNAVTVENLSRQASGVYVVVVRLGGETMYQKMIRAK